jgi:Carboxylesterase family
MQEYCGCTLDAQPTGGFLGEYRDDDGANLIHSGPVVYIYAAYRLGILGFLADQALGRHSGDYGLQDQQFAPALGEAEHRRLRRQPTQRHDSRRVRQRRQRV